MDAASAKKKRKSSEDPPGYDPPSTPARQVSQQDSLGRQVPQKDSLGVVPPLSDPPSTLARQVPLQENHPRSPSMPASMMKDLTSAISKPAERSEEDFENCENGSPPKEVVDLVEALFPEQEEEEVVSHDNVGDHVEDSLGDVPAKKRKEYTIGVKIDTIGKTTVQGVPMNAKIIFVGYLSRLEKEASQFRKLKKLLSRKRFNYSDIGRWILACGLSQVPKVSLYSLEQAIPCIHAALLASAGIDFDFDELAQSSPSADTLGKLLYEAAADCLLLYREQLKKAEAVLISCDKGMRSGIDHFPKLLSYFDFERDRVEKILLDVEGSGSDSKAAATAIDQSIKMKLGDDVLQFLSGQTTDSGGGGDRGCTRESKERTGALRACFPKLLSYSPLHFA
jgi:hypothetical protein